MRGAFQRETFPDGSEIKLYAGTLETDGEIVGVQFDMFHAGATARCGKLDRCRDAPARPRQPPHAQKRGDRNVESTGRFAVQAFGMREEVKDGRLHRDGFVRGAGVDAANLAGRIVKAEFPVEAFDLREGLLGGGAEGHAIGAVEEHLEARGHRVAGEGDGRGI
ncbi:hypothetical protein LBMAG56_34220 [Verrucomicrobiota bacterium]|nr:hypothetical protein LBMAG56_34220 [Verrucomicrobiota bacterium]